MCLDISDILVCGDRQPATKASPCVFRLSQSVIHKSHRPGWFMTFCARTKHIYDGRIKMRKDFSLVQRWSFHSSLLASHTYTRIRHTEFFNRSKYFHEAIWCSGEWVKRCRATKSNEMNLTHLNLNVKSVSRCESSSAQICYRQAYQLSDRGEETESGRQKMNFLFRTAEQSILDLLFLISNNQKAAFLADAQHATLLRTITISWTWSPPWAA